MSDFYKKYAYFYAKIAHMAAVKKNIPLSLLELNEGQLSVIDPETNRQVGLPRNPRWIRDARFEALKKSIEDAPEMLDLREILVYSLSGIKGKDGRYIVIGGNMRLRALRELGYAEAPCKVLDPATPMEKLREYTIKDNEGFGQNDFDILANEWDGEELSGWGMEAAEWGDIEPASGDDSNSDGDDVGDDEEQDSKYSQNIGQVIYEPKNTSHAVSDLYELPGDEYDEAIEALENEELKAMFRIRKDWFCNFNFSRIADYYAYQASPEEQRVFEKLGLVLLDRDQLIENGFAEIVKDFRDDANH